MHWIQYAIPVLCCTLTGWVTTLVAMKSILHPRQSRRFLGMQLQGIYPKNKELILQELGRIAGKELLPAGMLEEKLSDPQLFQQIKPEIEKHIDHFLREKLTDVFPLLAQFIGDKTINKLKAAFLSELESLFPSLLKNYMGQLTAGLDPQKLLTEKINDLSLTDTSPVLADIIQKEVRLLQLRGALTGLLIGLLQLVLFILMF